MKTKRNFIFTILLTLLISCDPPHSIEFINDGDSDLKVKFEIDKKVGNHSLMYNENLSDDSLTINIKKKDTAKIDFGIGTWSNSEIRIQANSLNKLEIENKDFRTVYKTKERIEEVLKENRKSGILGNGWSTKIVFKIK